MPNSLFERLLAAQTPEDEMLLMLTALPPALSDAVWAAAVPHWFDARVLEALLPNRATQAADLYTQLQSMAFIEPYHGRGHNVHELTRRTILKLWWDKRRDEYRQMSERAEAHFAAQDDDGARIEAAYHSLVTPAFDLARVASRWSETASRLKLSGQFSLVYTLVQNVKEHITAGRVPETVEQLMHEWERAFDRELATLTEVGRKNRVATGQEHISPHPLELGDVLSRFQIETNTTTHALCRQAFDLMQEGRLPEAVKYAQAALRDGTSQNDRNAQALACAYLAAVNVLQENFVEAVRQANDCHHLFNWIGSQHNTAVAKALLAVIYQMHLEALSRDLVDSLQDSWAQTKVMESKALSKGESGLELVRQYHEQSIEFGDAIRRAKWIRAIPHLLPLVWVPVISEMPSDPQTQSAEIEAYMEPALFVLRTKQEAADEEAGRINPGQINDALYTARPLPSLGGSDPSEWRPPRLRPNARYVAIQIDPDSAHLEGFEPDDYLLVRSLNSAERAELLKQAADNVSGLYFEVDASGKVEFVKAIPPRFVGEEHVRMLVAQVDAVLRRVP